MQNIVFECVPCPLYSLGKKVLVAVMHRSAGLIQRENRVDHLLWSLSGRWIDISTK